MKTKVLVPALCAALCLGLASCTGTTGAAGGAGPAGADGVICVSFQEGAYPSDVYTLASDTYIVDGSPDNNYSPATLCYAGSDGDIARTLLKFDISSLVPSGVKVESAYLTVYASATANITITAHAATGPWEEAEATWNSSAAGVTWAAAGGDYGALQDSEPIGTALAFHSFEISPALVESWLATPAANYGILLKSSDETIAEYAGLQNSRAPTVSARPRLTVYYTLP